MPRSPYPSMYQVEITGPGQGCDWSGEVQAFSREGAALMAGAAAERAGVMVLADSWIMIERKE